MSSKRIFCECPETNLTVITSIAYREMWELDGKPIVFCCPCGGTHELTVTDSRVKLLPQPERTRAQ